MLAVLHAEDALFGMDIVGGGDIDCIYQRAFSHFFQGSEGVWNAVLGGKFIGSFLCAGADCCQLKTFILPCSGNHPVGYVVGADYSKTYLLHNPMLFLFSQS